jgi:hypothetical protein
MDLGFYPWLSLVTVSLLTIAIPLLELPGLGLCFLPSKLWAGSPFAHMEAGCELGVRALCLPCHLAQDRVHNRSSHTFGDCLIG